MAKLNQILAVEKSVKTRANDAITKSYHMIQKSEPWNGIARTYTPKDEDGDQLPPESTKVQVRADDVINVVNAAFTELFDVTAQKDWANTDAKANVVVDGVTVIADAPVTYLLWLEKQLTDLRTFFTKLPTLDPSVDWTLDDVSASYKTAPVQTIRQKKVPKNHVKAEATDKHPAQVEMFTEDVLVGYWSTVKFSGAVPQGEVNKYVRKVEALQEAVKQAREEANSIDAPSRNVGEAIFSYILG